jgi:PTH1 family peptidyl-tRNA hydrolase
MTWLIVGLGNPGVRYQSNRHNIGFMIVDHIARTAGYASFAAKFRGESSTGKIHSEHVVLLKPSTFMNKSGESVQAAMTFLKVTPAQLIVIHDELDLPLGHIRLKQDGGHGGHNGIRNITEKIGADFIRVRAGIGRPEGEMSVSSHVLSDFRIEEDDAKDHMIQHAVDAVAMILNDGLESAQNTLNRRK